MLCVLLRPKKFLISARQTMRRRALAPRPVVFNFTPYRSVVPPARQHLRFLIIAAITTYRHRRHFLLYAQHYVLSVVGTADTELLQPYARRLRISHDSGGSHH